jgi:hypothetical protein
LRLKQLEGGRPDLGRKDDREIAVAIEQRHRDHRTGNFHLSRQEEYTRGDDVEPERNQRIRHHAADADELIERSRDEGDERGCRARGITELEIDILGSPP